MVVGVVFWSILTSSYAPCGRCHFASPFHYRFYFVLDASEVVYGLYHHKFPGLLGLHKRARQFSKFQCRIFSLCQPYRMLYHWSVVCGSSLSSLQTDEALSRYASSSSSLRSLQAFCSGLTFVSATL